MSALDTQIAGNHYRLPIQPVEFIASNNWDYFAGNVLKYVVRWDSKGGIADLEKALHYADIRAELVQIRRAGNLGLMIRIGLWFINTGSRLAPPSTREPITMLTFVEKNGLDRDRLKGDLLLNLECLVQGKMAPHHFRARMQAYLTLARARVS